MKKHALLFLLTLFAAANLHANLLRVNNTAGYAAGFTTLTAAVAAANAGDTIYVEPSPTPYDASVGVIQINKKVVIVGNGYYLGFNTNLQVRNNDSAIQPLVQFVAGSAGSVATGINFQGNINILADDLTVKRCAINNFYLGSNYQTGQQVNTTQTQVLECFIYGSIGLSADQPSTNTALLIKNNIFAFNTSGSVVSFSIGDQGVFENNTVLGRIEFNNAVFNFVNNLVQYGLRNFGNVANSHNTCACTNDFPTGADNVTGTTWANLFLGGNGDQFFRTNPSGPAANTGFYGANDDRGAFTDEPGRATYRLGGVPEFPAIYKLLGGGTVNGPTIQVTLSARSNN